MQIRTIRKGFEAFECKFEQFERDSKHSNAMQILNIWRGFEAFESKLKPLKKDSKHSNENSNHSKGIRSIRKQIQTIRNGF